MAYEDAIGAYKNSLTQRGQDKSTERKPVSQSSTHRENETTTKALDELNMHCEYHLLHVANFDMSIGRKLIRNTIFGVFWSPIAPR